MLNIFTDHNKTHEVRNSKLYKNYILGGLYFYRAVKMIQKVTNALQDYPRREILRLHTILKINGNNFRIK